MRAAAAGHPNLPQEFVPLLLEDEEAGVAESMGSSPALTVDWMHRLLDAAGSPGHDS